MLVLREVRARPMTAMTISTAYRAFLFDVLKRSIIKNTALPSIIVAQLVSSISRLQDIMECPIYMPRENLNSASPSTVYERYWTMIIIQQITVSHIYELITSSLCSEVISFFCRNAENTSTTKKPIIMNSFSPSVIEGDMSKGYTATIQRVTNMPSITALTGLSLIVASLDSV